MPPVPAESFDESEPIWEDDETTQESIQNIPIQDTHDALLTAFPEPYYRQPILQAIRTKTPPGTKSIQIFTIEIRNTPNMRRNYRVRALYIDRQGKAISYLSIGDYGIREN